MTKIHLALVVVLAIGVAHGADRFWDEPSGGAFDDGANWSEFTVPNSTDTAIFDLSAIYPVTFSEDALTDRVRVDRGIVTFDLGAGAIYELEQPLPTSPGVTVGTADGAVGALEVLGGMIRARHATVGGAGGLGMLDLLDGAAFAIDGELHVGDGGAGFLTAAGGAHLSSLRGVLGHVGGDYGAADLSGAATTWNVLDAVIVGNGSVGDLVVRDGASLRCGSAVLGQFAGAEGTVEIDGGQWTIDGPLDVGMHGTGLLELTNGAALVTHDFATIGTFPADSGDVGGRGTVILDGGATWTIHGGFFAGDLYVGFLGDGVLELRGGARIVIDGRLEVDPYGAGSGTLVIEVEGDGADEPALDVSGSAAGAIELRFAPGDEPALGATYRILRAAGGHDVALTLPPPPADAVWGTATTATELVAFVVPASCAEQVVDDCNANGIDDACELAWGVDDDCDANGVPDRCQLPDDDCNGNGVPDACDIALGAPDCNANGIPDSCERFAASSLLDPDGVAGEFGYAVAASGDRLVVGARSAEAHGLALVYRREGVAWIHEATLEPDVLAPDTRFGASVDIDGNRIVVGAPGYAGPIGEGAVFVFDRRDEQWTPSARLDPSDAILAQFGGDVAVDGPVVAVGAKDADSFGWFSVLRDDGATWTTEHVDLVSPNSSGFTLATARVAVAGNVLVTGYPRNGGRVKILRHDGDAWIVERLLVPDQGASFGGPLYGVPVSTDGTRIAFGGKIDGESVVYVLRHDEEGWIEESVVRQNVEVLSTFGSFAHVQGDVLIAGAPGGAAGAIFRFRLDPAGWVMTDVLRSALDSGGLGADVDQSAGWIVSGTYDDGVAIAFAPGDGDCNENGIPDRCDVLAGTSPDLNGNGIPDECEDLCPADLDDSGAVDFADLVALLSTWGPCPACDEDLDDDGAVGFTDLLLMLTAWGPCS